GESGANQVGRILIDGGAAFAGQGVVGGSLEFSDLRRLGNGRPIPIIVNNQIGFTTSPSFARSSPYPSDVAKGVQAPIFHVNGDDPEAVVEAARAAVEYRQRFKKDVVIDLFCYRRHGHNESDEPAFTQPLMYRKIARQLEAKRAALASGEGIDWATAEALAIGTLCAEGTHVRLSGQDSGRGTFSHRHAVLVDQETEERYVPINHIRDEQAPFEI